MYHKAEIQKLLRKLGSNNSYLGFYYLTFGTQLTIEDETRITYISKWLYPEIAKKYNTSVSCVERDIRTVVTVIWEHGDRELLDELASINLKQKPKNAKFIAIVANYIKQAHSITVF